MYVMSEFNYITLTVTDGNDQSINQPILIQSAWPTQTHDRQTKRRRHKHDTNK